jgi:tetratricopeptide (TPR) repeat protein
MRWLPIPLLCLPLVCAAADTVMVIPLFNVNEAESANLDWIGESAAETIHESLGSAGLMVLARDDRQEVYRRLGVRGGPVLTKATVIKIGETLDAGEIVFGEFDVAPDAAGERTLKSNLKLTVRAIDLKKMHEFPPIELSGPLEDLSEMEMKASWRMLKEISPNTAGTEEDFLRTRPAVRVESMESYVRGLMAANPEQQIKLFTQAARLDEHFSEPDFQLGRLYFQRREYKTAEQWLPKVSHGDPHYMESLFLLGICRYHDGDFDGAIQDFRTVLADVPLNEVYNNLGAALSRKNDPAAADNFRKALEGDEADPDYWFNLGFALWKKGDFKQAADDFRAVLDRSKDDQDATYFLGRSLRGDGPRAGDPRSDGRERIKTTFEDSAFRQLQAELKSKAK